MTRRRRLKKRLFWTSLLLGLLLLVLAATLAQAAAAVPCSASRLLGRLAGVVNRQGGRTMQSRIPRTLVALAVGIAIGSVSLASAAPSANGPQTMTLIAVVDPKSEVSVDGGASGEGPGDMFIFSERLYRGSAQIGRTEIVCLVLGLRGLHCQGTLLLPAGKIQAGGFVSFRDVRTFRVPVLGGTERYAGAKGQLVITSLSENRDRYVVRLTA